jgi:hypothetical protein
VSAYKKLVKEMVTRKGEGVLASNVSAVEIIRLSAGYTAHCEEGCYFEAKSKLYANQQRLVAMVQSSMRWSSRAEL